LLVVSVLVIVIVTARQLSIAKRAERCNTMYR